MVGGDDLNQMKKSLGAYWSQNKEPNEMVIAGKLMAMEAWFRELKAKNQEEGTTDRYNTIRLLQELGSSNNPLIKQMVIRVAMADPDERVIDEIRGDIKPGAEDVTLMKELINSGLGTKQSFDGLAAIVATGDLKDNPLMLSDVTGMVEEIGNALRPSVNASAEARASFGNFVVTQVSELNHGASLMDEVNVIYLPLAQEVLGRESAEYKNVANKIDEIIKGQGTTKDENNIVNGTPDEQMQAYKDLVVNGYVEPRSRQAVGAAIGSANTELVLDILNNATNRLEAIGPRLGDRDPIVVGARDRVLKEANNGNPQIVIAGSELLLNRTDINGTAIVAEAYKTIKNDQKLKSDLLAEVNLHNAMSVDYVYPVVEDFAAVLNRMSGNQGTTEDASVYGQYLQYLNTLVKQYPQAMQEEIKRRYAQSSNAQESSVWGKVLQDNHLQLAGTAQWINAIGFGNDAELNNALSDMDKTSNAVTLPDAQKLMEATEGTSVERQIAIVPHLSQLKVDYAGLGEAVDPVRLGFIKMYENASVGLKQALLNGLKDRGSLSKDAFTALWEKDNEGQMNDTKKMAMIDSMVNAKTTDAANKLEKLLRDRSIAIRIYAAAGLSKMDDAAIAGIIDSTVEDRLAERNGNVKEAYKPFWAKVKANPENRSILDNKIRTLVGTIQPGEDDPLSQELLALGLGVNQDELKVAGPFTLDFKNDSPFVLVDGEFLNFLDISNSVRVDLGGVPGTWSDGVSQQTRDLLNTLWTSHDEQIIAATADALRAVPNREVFNALLVKLGTLHDTMWTAQQHIVQALSMYEKKGEYLDDPKGARKVLSPLIALADPAGNARDILRAEAIEALANLADDTIGDVFTDLMKNETKPEMLAIVTDAAAKFANRTQSNMSLAMLQGLEGDGTFNWARVRLVPNFIGGESTYTYHLRTMAYFDGLRQTGAIALPDLDQEIDQYANREGGLKIFMEKLFPAYQAIVKDQDQREKKF